jgi:hypothetical protein
MERSIQTINAVNKAAIEEWLAKLSREIEKSNIQNDELTSAIETLRYAIQPAKPNFSIIKSGIEAIKAIGYGIIASAAYQTLMAHPPL